MHDKIIQNQKTCLELEAIQRFLFDLVTIYRLIGWSNCWPLGIDIDHFENHSSSQCLSIKH